MSMQNLRQKILLFICMLAVFLPFFAKTTAKATITEPKEITPSDMSSDIPTKQNKNCIYLVKRGDTLWKISKKFNTSIDKILEINPEIKCADLIYVDQLITINLTDLSVEVKTVKRPIAKEAHHLSDDYKTRILKNVSAKSGIPWQILAGLSKQESQFGLLLVGDRGKSRGPFHIHLPSHPEVTVEQAMNWEWSSNWAANYLIKLGAKQDIFRALRLWNGSETNPKTYRHATSVIKHAKKYFGYVEV